MLDALRSTVFGPCWCVDVPRCLAVRLYLGMTTPTRVPLEPTYTTTRPLLVSVEQAARMLSISRSSIYLLMESDQLTPIRIGRSVRFPVEQLEQFVADRMPPGTDQSARSTRSRS